MSLNLLILNQVQYDEENDSEDSILTYCIVAGKSIDRDNRNKYTKD